MCTPNVCKLIRTKNRDAWNLIKEYDLPGWNIKPGGHIKVVAPNGNSVIIGLHSRKQALQKCKKLLEKLFAENQVSYMED
jgi:hypothetical protein